jgi:hypothetical protein
VTEIREPAQGKNALEQHETSSDKLTSQKIAWGPLLMIVSGDLLFLLGAGRFVFAHRFNLNDALYCGLAVIPALLLLLVTAYVIQHAIWVSIIPLAAAVALVASYAAFDVALGLALLGMIRGSTLNQRT